MPLQQAASVLKCPCFPVTENDIEEQVLGFLYKKQAGYAVAINAEKIHRFQKDEFLQKTISNALFPYPDGAGAVLGLRWLHGFHSEKINMPIRILELANKYKLKVFIAGAKESTHQIAIENIQKSYPLLNIVGHLHGYHSEEVITKTIKDTQPQIIMLALGSPKQEFFAAKLARIIPSGFIIGCGGALDILAGNLKRAPEFWINNNFEWLYRLIQEPWRLRRQLFLPFFMIRLLLNILKTRCFRSKLT